MPRRHLTAPGTLRRPSSAISLALLLGGPTACGDAEKPAATVPVVTADPSDVADTDAFDFSNVVEIRDGAVAPAQTVAIADDDIVFRNTTSTEQVVRATNGTFGDTGPAESTIPPGGSSASARRPRSRSPTTCRPSQASRAGSGWIPGSRRSDMRRFVAFIPLGRRAIVNLLLTAVVAGFAPFAGCAAETAAPADRAVCADLQRMIDGLADGRSTEAVEAYDEMVRTANEATTTSAIVTVARKMASITDAEVDESKLPMSEVAALARSDDRGAGTHSPSSSTNATTRT